MKAETNGASRPWLSNLTVSAFTMLQTTGFQPVGMVTGASVYRFGTQLRGTAMRFQPRYGVTGSARVAHFGLQPKRAGVRPPRRGTGADYVIYECRHMVDSHLPGVNYEDEHFELAITEAFGNALTRLREEAAQLGAHGVTSVRLEVSRPSAYGGAAPTSELRMTGTAIRAPGLDQLTEPFTSHLSGQSFAKLVAGGWIPTDIVIGAGVIRSYMGCVGGSDDLWGRKEFTQRSMAIQRSRELAVEHLTTAVPGNSARVIGAAPVGPFGDRRAFDIIFEHVLVGTAAIPFQNVQSELPPFAVCLDPSNR